MIGLLANHTIRDKSTKAALPDSPCIPWVSGQLFSDRVPTPVGQITSLICGYGGASPRFMTRYTLHCPGHTHFSAVCLLN